MEKRNGKMIDLLILVLVLNQYPTVYGFLGATWSAFEVMNTVHDVVTKFTTPSTADLMDQALELSDKVDELGDTLGKIQKSMELLLTRLPLEGKISRNVDALNSFVGRIDVLYGEFEDYIDNSDHFGEESLKKLLATFTSFDQTNVGGTVGQMHALIHPKRTKNFKKSLLLLLAQESQDNAMALCDTGSSPQKRLLELFQIIIDTEMKASVLMAFGLVMEGYIYNTTVTGDLKRAEMQMEARGEDYLKVLKETLKLAPTQFRRCDPAEGYIRGDTFYEFERFLQIFITQQTTLTDLHTCPGSCYNSPQPTRLYVGRSCDGFECSGSETTCYGRVSSCTTLTISNTVQLCEYNPLQIRRYAWFYNQNGQLYGNDENGCPDGDIYRPYVRSVILAASSRWCAVCRCHCSEDSPKSWSSRFVSLRQQITNVKDNMVATGLHLVIKDKIVHIRVMQSKLGPNATILPDSTSWVEPENIQYDKEKSVDTWSNKFYKKSEENDYEEMINDEDVAAFTLEEKRINLDTLILPKNYILTGVKFGRNMEESSKPIQLELHGTMFDYETGQLEPDTTIWVTPENGKERKAYKNDAYKNPMKLTTTEIDSKPYTFIDIHISDLLEDAGQTTLPLLDGLPVIGEPPVPLVGVGLYHKGQPEYGGFLTFVLEEINRSYYLPSKL